MFYKRSAATVSRRDGKGNVYIALPDWTKPALGSWVKAIPFTYVNTVTDTVIGAGVQLFSKETWSISEEDVLFRTSTPVFDKNGNETTVLQWFIPNRICQLSIEDECLIIPRKLADLLKIKSECTEVVFRQEVIDIFLEAEQKIGSYL